MAIPILAAVFFAGCGGKAKQQDPGAGAPPVVKVEREADASIVKVDKPEQFMLATAAEYSASTELGVTGTVSPDVSRSVPVPSLVSGKAVEVLARLGDEVKKGQLLLKVRSSDVAGAHSDYRKAVVAERLTLMQSERAKLLFEKGALAKKDLEVAQNAEDSAKVDLETTAERLRLLGSDLDHPTGIVEVLPVEAYPDVANNYVQVITQWPGRRRRGGGAAGHHSHRRSQMNGIPHLDHLRSTSLFGLSSVMLIFDDQSDNDWNRQKVLESALAGDASQRSAAADRTDFSPVGQIYWYTLKSTNPQYDVMELKSLEDWVLEKQFKSVPNVVDVSSFGGATGVPGAHRPGQAGVLRAEHRAGGAAARQQQRERRRQLHRSRPAADQRARGRAGQDRSRHRGHGGQDARRDAGAGQRHRDGGAGPKIRLGQIGQGDSSADGKVIDNGDVVEGIVLLRKGANSDSTLDAIHDKVEELNEHILPPGVKIVPFLDRSDLVHSPRTRCCTT
jgi:multidrug efflux pump subunit AcrA (membrane-fusion protein)